MPFTKGWFVTTILIVSLLVPLMAIKEYAFPWHEAIEVLEEQYPGQSFLSISGSWKWSSNSGTYRKRIYLVWPSIEVVETSKVNDEGITVAEKDKVLVLYAIFALFLLISLFVFVAIPYIKVKFWHENKP